MIFHRAARRGIGFVRRRMATETKTPFSGPPPPPAKKGNDLARLLITGGGVVVIGYVFMLPENDYDLLRGLGTEPVPGDQKGDQQKTV